MYHNCVMSHMNGSSSKSSVYDMGTYTLNFSNSSSKQKKTLGSFVWEHLESPILLICIGIVSAIVSYILSFASNFSEYNKEILTQSDGYVVWTLYTISNISLAIVSLYMTFSICPDAVGGGIADVKVILSGSVNPDKLSIKLIIAKFLGLGFALASGLSVGKEGPLVHITSAVAEQLMLLESFNNIHQNTSKRLEILACACASGVSSTFGAAYGGVLYSIEVTCTTYMARNIPRAYLSSIVAMLVFLALGATSHITLYTKLGPKTHDHEQNGLHSMIKHDELFVMIGLGTICGLVGVVFVKLVRVVCILRNQYLDKRLPTAVLSRRRYIIVCTAAALITPLIYLEQGFGATSDRYRLIDVLFRIQPVDLSLRTLLYFPVKFIMTIVCVTLPLPVGLFSPVFLLGGVLGRILGHLVSGFPLLHAGVPARDFALIGAAAFSTGVTRSISTAVIVYELSGRLHLHLPLSVAILAAYFTSNRFSKSVYDVLIECSGVDYLHNLPKDAFSVTAADVMLPIDSQLVLDLDCTYRDAQIFVNDIELSPNYIAIQNVALVQSRHTMVLIGTVNIESMKCKLEADGFSTRSNSAENIFGGDDSQSTNIRKFLSRMRSKSSASFGEFKEKCNGHEKIRFIMLKDKGVPLAAVACDAAPGWKWQDAFSLDETVIDSSTSTGDISRSRFVPRAYSQSNGAMRSTGNGSLAGLVNELRTPPIVRVDPSPYQMLCQVDCTMRLHKIDSLMRMLKLNELYVTSSGRIVGIITRRCLGNFIGDRAKRPTDTMFELLDLMKESICCKYLADCCCVADGDRLNGGGLLERKNRYSAIPTPNAREDENATLL